MRRPGDLLRRSRPELRGLDHQAVEMAIAAMMRTCTTAMAAEGVDPEVAGRVAQRVFEAI